MSVSLSHKSQSRRGCTSSSSNGRSTALTSTPLSMQCILCMVLDQGVVEGDPSHQPGGAEGRDQEAVVPQVGPEEICRVHAWQNPGADLRRWKRYPLLYMYVKYMWNICTHMYLLTKKQKINFSLFYLIFSHQPAPNCVADCTYSQQCAARYSCQ